MYYVMADTITEKEIGYYKCGFRVLEGGEPLLQMCSFCGKDHLAWNRFTKVIC